MTIGNFDGCHLGHQELIKITLDAAEATHTSSVAMTFYPRPEAFFREKTDIPSLFTLAQKTRALGELGLDYVITQNFDHEFSQLRHDEFYQRVLLDACCAQHITVGRDFSFGRGRLGNAIWLQTAGVSHGTSVKIGSDVYHAAERISSTRIREALAETGNVALAAHLLGRPYLIEGRIEPGDQIGRTWGYPTANLAKVAQIVPMAGVYAGWVWLPRKEELPDEAPPIMRLPDTKIPAVFSIGLRPTLSLPNPVLRVEAHLLAGTYGENALYGLKAGYYLTHRLRADRRFPDLDALKAQIAQDALHARTILTMLPGMS